MRVLEDKAKAWTYDLKCPHCGSPLTINASDVYQETFSGVDSYSTYYGIECGACTKQIGLNDHRGIPEWVRSTARTKAHVIGRSAKRTSFLGGTVHCVGTPEDRGCVSCGQTAKERETYIVDSRNRYWCVGCTSQALANVRRRVDERTDYVYPWTFPTTKAKHGPGGLGGPGPCDAGCAKCAYEAQGDAKTD